MKLSFPSVHRFGNSLVLVALSVVATALPTWALSRAQQPALRSMKRAQVIQVVNYDTLVVQIEGEGHLRYVEMIGLEALPAINPAWTSITGLVPLPVYEAGQYLQDTLNHKEVYLEMDPRYVSPEGLMAAYVWRGQTLVNQEMLLRGFALAEEAEVPLKYEAILQEALEVAQRQGRGVWRFDDLKPGLGENETASGELEPAAPVAVKQALR